ncbi:MAG: 3-phosphoshikimate 1-carboxyvinyltransferase, partial [Clostridia bacterium]|nr:3-phosphoshikimate 1-carboxyvinyltransferase [Clostridia bacterium]
MIHTVKGGPRFGTVSIPASKSQAHRLLICSALAKEETSFSCDCISKDIQATIDCLNALGAEISEKAEGILSVKPIANVPKEPRYLPCGESGSTLRFLIPAAGALGADCVFRMKGRLPERPIEEYLKLLSDHGMAFRKEKDILYCSGMLAPGAYAIPGDISSQYISGLLFALPLIDGESTLKVTGSIGSADYIAMTENTLKQYGISFKKCRNTYTVPGRQHYRAPSAVKIESDWSNAAFFLCIGAFSPNGVTVRGMSADTLQGD